MGTIVCSIYIHTQQEREGDVEDVLLRNDL